ncbi:MAG: alcohol dehydrogenase catalytic domain-containing protein [Atribacterota bacterium]
MIPEKMKAWIFYEPEVMKFEEVPVPEVADDEILIRVRACGICGSDVAYYWGFSPLETPTGKGPLILGHKFSGEVVKVGKIPAERKLFSVSDRVTVKPVQYCNACEVCHRGFVNLCENKKSLESQRTVPLLSMSFPITRRCTNFPEMFPLRLGLL